MEQLPSAPSLQNMRRISDGEVPPAMCTAAADGTPHVTYLSVIDYVDPQHIALSYQFFNQSRRNVLATGRASVAMDDPYSGAGIVMQLQYLRTETSGPVFERLRARLDGVAAHSGMDKVFQLRGADIYQVLELRHVPGRNELPAALPRCDLMAGARAVSERMADCADLEQLLDAMMTGLSAKLQIEHAMLWMIEDGCDSMTLLASNGYAQQATGAEIALGDGLAGIAARNGVAIRVGHMVQMRIYGRAVRGRAGELGLDALLNEETPLPGLCNPRSQVAVPLRAQGRVLGVLFVESLHDQFFGHDDEDALTILCCQFASALTLMRAPAEAEAEAAPAAGAVPAAGAPDIKVQFYAADGSSFLDGSYLIKGVAGAIFWKLVRDYAGHGRREFSTRELRLAANELGLPDVQHNLDVRLLMLQRRLAERQAPVRIERAGRGRFRLLVEGRLCLADPGS